MNLLTTNGVKIYNVSAGKSLPEWLSEKKRDELRKNKEFRSRVELIQDFSFETSSQRVKYTPDGQYLIAAGIYKPQIKIFELSQLSNKVTRHLDSHVVQMEILSQDYSKPVFLRADRYVEFHAKNGSYFTLRTPKQGRDMSYHKDTCDLLIAGKGSEVYRLNLEEGRFMQPFQTDLTDINVIAQNPVHQLMLFGGENGVIECWDPRQRRRCASLDIDGQLSSEYNGAEISAAKFGPDGLSIGIGTSTGVVQLYDLRTNIPTMTKYHQYQLPINSINFHSFANVQRILSSDSKSLKVFEKNTGKIFMVLEPKDAINDVVVQDGSGLLLMPGECPKIQSYYVPSLGPAPKWASFLDNLTEELEEDKQLVYEDYKFITREEVEQLNMTNMIGTGYLRAYMHGYFIHIKLYNKIKAIQNPFEYEQYRAQLVQDAMKEQVSSRVSATAKASIKQPKVNSKLVERLEARIIAARDDDKKKIAEQAASSVKTDSRFDRLFKDKDFEIDEGSAEFKKHNPADKIAKLDAAYKEHFQNIVDDDDDDDDDEDDDNQVYNKNNNNKNSSRMDIDEDDEDDDDNVYDYDYDKEDLNNNKNGKTKKKSVAFYEMKTGHTLSSLTNNNQSNVDLLKNAPLSIRVDTQEKGLANLKNSKIKKMDTAENAETEISFVPTSSGKKSRGGSTSNGRGGRR